jgi:hypothetical protein
VVDLVVDRNYIDLVEVLVEVLVEDHSCIGLVGIGLVEDLKVACCTCVCQNPGTFANGQKEGGYNLFT